MNKLLKDEYLKIGGKYIDSIETVPSNTARHNGEHDILVTYRFEELGEMSRFIKAVAKINLTTDITMDNTQKVEAMGEKPEDEDRWICVNDMVTRIPEGYCLTEPFTVEFGGDYQLQIAPIDGKYKVTNGVNGYGNNCKDEFKNAEVKILCESVEAMGVQPGKMCMSKLRTLLNAYDGEEISISKFLEEINNHFTK